MFDSTTGGLYLQTFDFRSTQRKYGDDDNDEEEEDSDLNVVDFQIFFNQKPHDSTVPCTLKINQENRELFLNSLSQLNIAAGKYILTSLFWSCKLNVSLDPKLF